MNRLEKIRMIRQSLKMDQIRIICIRHCIPCGVHVVMPEPAVLKQRIDEGYRFIAYSIDAVFLNTSVIAPS